MDIGMCVCGNCRYCGYQWAPPVDVWTTNRTIAIVDQQMAMERSLARLVKPRFKRHADGSCTPLPSHAAEMLGARL